MRVIGLAGWSGSGKTTVLTGIIPVLAAAGLRISTVKRAHHSFEIDQPGKDSYEHRRAGATEVLVASSQRFALIHELRQEAEPGLASLLSRLSPVDLVLVEGFKHGAQRKIEISRRANGQPFLHTDDPMVVALACDEAPPGLAIPHVPLDDLAGIAGLVTRFAEPLDALLARLQVSG